MARRRVVRARGKSTVCRECCVGVFLKNIGSLQSRGAEGQRGRYCSYPETWRGYGDADVVLRGRRHDHYHHGALPPKSYRSRMRVRWYLRRPSHHKHCRPSTGPLLFCHHRISYIYILCGRVCFVFVCLASIHPTNGKFLAQAGQETSVFRPVGSLAVCVCLCQCFSTLLCTSYTRCI